MQCMEVRQQLNTLVDGERLAGLGQYARIAGHCLSCADCRAVWRLLKHQQQIARHLSPASLPAGLRERVMASLPAAEARPGLADRGSGNRTFRRPAVVITAAAVLAAALVAVTPRRGSKPGAAAVEAAVQSANTWHLVGWKVRGRERIPWEIWGRRTPFFYREQIGDELNFDDGKQRVRVVSTGQNGKRLALRLQSGPAPSDAWREWMTMGTGWRFCKPWRESRNELVWRGHDSGMQGPWTAADSYVAVDRRSWLPVRYEYRQYRTNPMSPSWLAAVLVASYDVPLSDSITSLRLTPDLLVADTLSPPTDPSIPTTNVQRAHGLTVQVQALAMDPDGNILVRVRSWLGNLKLGAEGTATWNGVGTDVKYRTYGQTRDTAYHSDDGAPYVAFDWPRVPLDQLVTGDTLMLLAPLEPRPPGSPLPRSLILDLDSSPQLVRPDGSRDGSTVLFDQSFLWTVPLPDHAAPIRIDDYLPSGHRQRFHYQEGTNLSTVPANIAASRACQYEVMNDYDQSIYWQKRCLALLPPFSSDAQFRRLSLAGAYEHAGDRTRAAQTYHEVIAISQRHPETWSYYGWQARKVLEYMATHKPRGQARRIPVGATPMKRAAVGHPGGAQP